MSFGKPQSCLDLSPLIVRNLAAAKNCLHKLLILVFDPASRHIKQTGQSVALISEVSKNMVLVFSKVADTKVVNQKQTMFELNCMKDSQCVKRI